MKVKNLVFALTIGICVLVFTARADAQLANIAMAELYISIMDACEGWLVKAGAIALELLAVTAVIGFAIGMKDLVLAGNATLDSIVAFFVRFSFQAGLMVWASERAAAPIADYNVDQENRSEIRAGYQLWRSDHPLQQCDKSAH